MTLDLRSHLALNTDLLGHLERESQSLRQLESDRPTSAAEARRDILPRLEEALQRIRNHRSYWLSLSPEVRSTKHEIRDLLRQNQDLIMRMILLDRENEQLLLRRGLIPLSIFPLSSVSGLIMLRVFIRGITPLEVLRSLHRIRPAKHRWSHRTEFLHQLTAFTPPRRRLPSGSDSVGSVELAASSSARTSLFYRDEPPIGPRFVMRTNSPPLLPTASSHATRLSDSRVIAASFKRRGLPTGWN